MGAAVLPDGRKKDLLVDRLENRIFPLFEGRILSFDEPAAAVYAQIRSTARKQGKSGCRCRRLYRGYGKIAQNGCGNAGRFSFPCNRFESF